MNVLILLGVHIIVPSRPLTRTLILLILSLVVLGRYGVRDPFEVYNNEYAQCVYMVIYTQTDVLMEDQAEIIIKTKNSLVIDHLDAAILHLEIGRNLVKHIESSVDPDGL